MNSKRYNIKNWTRRNLRDWFTKIEKSNKKIKSFRADQVFNWLYQKRAGDFDQMKNIDIGTRKILEDSFNIRSLKLFFINSKRFLSVLFEEIKFNDIGIPFETLFIGAVKHGT